MNVPRILFIVPAFNEQANLRLVLGDLREHCPRTDVLVIDDGSTDGTAEVARKSGAAVVTLPFNLGIGGAVQTGLMFAARHGYDIAIQFDGDAQHRADQVHRLIQPLIDGSADAAIGSRFIGAGTYRPSFPRRVGIQIFRMVNRILTGRRITDNTSGFRAYGRDAIEFLATDYPHDYPEPESAATLVREGFRVAEVPVEMRIRQGGRSSITLLRSVYYMVKVVLAILVGATRRRTRSLAHERSGADHRDSGQHLGDASGISPHPKEEAP